MLLQINQSEGSLNSILQTKDLQEYWYLLLLGAILGITIVWRLFKRKKHKHSLDSEVNPPASEYQEYQTYIETKGTLIAETTKPLPTSESTPIVSPPGKNESPPDPIAIKKTAKEPQKNEPTTKNIDGKIILPKTSEVTTIVNISAKVQSVPINIGYDPEKIVVNQSELTYPYIVLPKANAKVILPQEGRTGRQGYKDADFKRHLSMAFGHIFQVDDNKLLLTNSGIAYSPDISLINTSNGLNLYIDIEIDEPYEGTNDIENRKAIHYRGCDENRNRAFVDSGWIVIRFAEIQVHQNPNGCCLHVADILSIVNPNFAFSNHLKSSEKIEQVSQWTKENAEIFSKNRKREEYLGLESFGTVAETKIIYEIERGANTTTSETILELRIAENEIKESRIQSVNTSLVKSYASTQIANELLATPLAIGDIYAGGIVFFIDGRGQYGLVAAPTDQSTGAPWGCYGSVIGGTSEPIGAGQANTKAILIKCAETGTAAQICHDLELGGYKDWFLPSENELRLMYTNLHLKGFGNFSPTFYWSSSENDNNGAQSVLFSDSHSDDDDDYKFNKSYVRAVRRFHVANDLLPAVEKIPSKKNVATYHFIGEVYAGGIVFFIDETGEHGLVTAPTDQSTGALWGYYANRIGGTSTAIGTGHINTAAILAMPAPSGTAAQICNDLELGGYKDWFLPSLGELNQMYENLHKKGLGNFSSTFYWSSSEYYGYHHFGARGVHFGNGTNNGSLHDGSYSVRAVRWF